MSRSTKNERRDYESVDEIWASRLWVGWRKEPILGYITKNNEIKDFMH